MSALLLGSVAWAEEPNGKNEAALMVDGVVREVFRSPRPSGTDVLVQIDVKRSEGRRMIQGASRPAFPGPGDTLYVHATSGPIAAGLAGDKVSNDNVPPERSQIRAYLNPRSTGGWEGIPGSWFEVTSAAGEAAAPAPPSSRVDTPANSSLGMTLEPLTVKERLVLRVKSVERGAAAEKAGLEVGDMIVGAKGAPLTGPDQLAELARTSEAIPLVVADVRTGRATQIELRPSRRGDGTIVDVQKPDTTEAAPPARSLGLSAEKVTLGQRTALKVIRVEPGSAAAKAGIELNDVLVAADGAPLTSPEQLGVALRKSGPTLTLTVRDSRSGRDVPVPIEFGGPQPPAHPLPDLNPNPKTEKGGLGAVTELAFSDTEAAVKVTEVTPGSPAARAGLEPGILILKADGKPVLHPNTLNEAVRSSSGKLKLLTVDPRNGRKSEIEVNLAP
jgi:S1-C subfamily serine protease